MVAQSEECASILMGEGIFACPFDSGGKIESRQLRKGNIVNDPTRESFSEKASHKRPTCLFLSHFFSCAPLQYETADAHPRIEVLGLGLNTPIAPSIHAG